MGFLVALNGAGRLDDLKSYLEAALADDVSFKRQYLVLLDRFHPDNPSFFPELEALHLDAASAFTSENARGFRSVIDLMASVSPETDRGTQEDSEDLIVSIVGEPNDGDPVATDPLPDNAGSAEDIKKARDQKKREEKAAEKAAKATAKAAEKEENKLADSEGPNAASTPGTDPSRRKRSSSSKSTKKSSNKRVTEVVLPSDNAEDPSDVVDELPASATMEEVEVDERRGEPVEIGGGEDTKIPVNKSEVEEEELEKYSHVGEPAAQGDREESIERSLPEPGRHTESETTYTATLGVIGGRNPQPNQEDSAGKTSNLSDEIPIERTPDPSSSHLDLLSDRAEQAAKLIGSFDKAWKCSNVGEALVSFFLTLSKELKG